MGENIERHFSLLSTTHLTFRVSAFERATDRVRQRCVVEMITSSAAVVGWILALLAVGAGA